jgi:phage terminase large subunit
LAASCAETGDFEGSVRIIAGPIRAFCDFAGGGDYNAFAVCEGNVVWIEDDWREKDTMATVGRFISLFKKLGLQGWQVGGDQGFGGALMDRLAEKGYHLKRVRNGDPAKNKKDFFNLSAEQWSTVAKLIENRQIIIRDKDPERLERLVKQLTSRQKIYDSDGRERLEPKDKMKARGLRSPDLADAVVGAVMLGPGAHPYAANPGLREQERKAMQECARMMERNRNPFAVERIDFSRGFF